jgi:pimeloyl-ACP methyl ester carboxylesterase
MAAVAPRAADAIEPPLGVGTLAGWGPYPVETREVSVPRRDGDGEFDARLYIPLAVNGGGGADGGGSDEGGVSSPMVAFGHGYLTGVGLYDETLRHLASWGVTLIAPRSGGGLFPDHEAFASDLAAALDAVAVAAADDDWPGLRVDVAARGVCGHSMGGGAALLAAAMDRRIRAMATLAAAETRPSAIAAATSISAPALFIAASDDAITPIDAHQRPMFEAIRSAPAQLRVIEGGSHCGFLD